MELIINGVNLVFPSVATLADLANDLDLPSFGSAVELNGEVVRRVAYPTTLLNKGDRLEIVRLVGGG